VFRGSNIPSMVRHRDWYTGTLAGVGTVTEGGYNEQEPAEFGTLDPFALLNIGTKMKRAPEQIKSAPEQLISAPEQGRPAQAVPWHASCAPAFA